MKNHHIQQITFLFTAIIMAICLTSCGSSGTGNSHESSYIQISQEEAITMMEESSNYLVVDVRTQEEYDEGHIPEAVCIPNETIEKEPPEELGDYEQILFIYCRTGRRSREAAQKLADMGYAQVYEMGGINTWPGEIEK